MGIKKSIHKLARSMGFDFYALKDRVDSEEQRLSWIRKMCVKTVFDIGANEGQFAGMMRKLLPSAMIYSFEPIPACYEKLLGNFKEDKNFAAFNVASGDKEEDLEINVNEYSPSSSLLDIEQLHVENYNHTAKTQKQLIKVKPLDSMMPEFKLERPLMVKIDTQGYESQVISGGHALLAQADIVLVELSYQPLYKGQALFHDIYTSLYQLGFRYHGNFEQMNSPLDGSVLQSDGFFLKHQ